MVVLFNSRKCTYQIYLLSAGNIISCTGGEYSYVAKNDEKSVLVAKIIIVATKTYVLATCLLSVG